MTLKIILITIAIFYIVNSILATIIALSERRSPASTWAWIMVLSFIPIVGFIIYFTFGKNTRRQQIFNQKRLADESQYLKYVKHNNKYEKIIEQQKKTIKQGDILIVGGTDKYIQDLVYLNLNAGSWVTKNNSVKVYKTGILKYSELLIDIRSAGKYIHMEYYIIRPDTLVRLIVSELAKKAAEGVEVRLMYDGMGCNQCPSDFFDPIKASGGQVVVFLPPISLRVNYRNHRKICIIDGQMAYIGGFNIGDEYLGIEPKYSYWRDAHMKIYGDAVDQIQLRFFMDWNFVSKVKVTLSKDYFPVKEHDGNVIMQVVSSGPDTSFPNIQYAYFKMITEAEKNIYIETPYFIPDDSILEALKVACLSGIEVKIIIPGNPDHPFVYWASLSYLGELLQCGAKCYQYERGFIHCKVLLVDSKIVSIGTANMDIRSFKLNFEINSIAYDRETTEFFESEFNNDLRYCTQITSVTYKKRSKLTKIKESVARLLSPML